MAGLLVGDAVVRDAVSGHVPDAPSSNL